MPERRFDSGALGQILYDIVLDFNERDAGLAIRRALVYRREDEPDDHTGRFVPDPYNDSQLIIKFATGLLADAAQHMTGVLTANPPVIQVNRLTVGDRKVTKAANNSAARVEAALNGQWWTAEEVNDIQEQIAWSQVVEGPGWYHSYAREAGFGLPDRVFHEAGEFSDEQLDEMRSKGALWPMDVLDPKDGKLKAAEPASLWMERREQALGQQRALNGESLFVTEALAAGAVYYKFDNGRELKFAAIRERVQAREFNAGEDLARAAAKANGVFDEEDIAKYSLIMDAEGRIVGGVSGDGTDPDRRLERGPWWTLWRVWFRDEVYYYVTSGSESDRGGKIVFWATHSVGHVPFYPAYGGITPSGRPAEQFQPLLEGAFSMVPGLNQAATLASSIMAFNGIPRFVIELPQGGLLANTQTGGPRTYTTDSPTGLDPNELEIIQQGGKIKQLTVDDNGMVLAVLQMYMEFLRDLLPSPSATGEGASTGPAWTTRLLQAANQIQVKPAIRSNAKAVGRMAKMWSNEQRKLDLPIWILGAPSRRASTKGQRALIEVKPGDWTQSLSVSQDPNTQEERITLQQIGLELWKAGAIQPRRMFDEYFGDDDPDESVLQLWENAILEHLIGVKPAPPGSLIETFASIVQGRMLERLARADIPNAQRLLAAQEAGLAGRLGEAGPMVAPPGGSAALPAAATARDGSTLGGPVTDAAGIRQAGVGMPGTQSELPTLESLAAPPG